MTQDTNISADDRLREARKQQAIGGMARHGTQRMAAKAAGVCRSTISNWLAEDEDFRKAMHDAKEDHVDTALEAIYERGVVGDEQLVFHQGEPIAKRDPDTGEKMLDDDFEVIYWTRTVKSDQLLLAFAKAHRQEYRDKGELALTGPDGGPVKTDQNITVTLVEAPAVDLAAKEAEFRAKQAAEEAAFQESQSEEG